jgi:hypothetical protein
LPLRRHYTIIAGLDETEKAQTIALIHVSAEDLDSAHEDAKLMLAKNVDDGTTSPSDWEVLYTFTGVLQPEEYFIEGTEDDVQELNDRHRDPGHGPDEQGGSGVGGNGEVQST